MLKYTLNEVIHDAEITGILHRSQSKFQECHVIESSALGRCLVLDNKIQSAEVDEFVYHESLVHPAMVLHPCPKNVFIGGGGEGATMREVLRHRCVEKVTMVDIDEVAVDVSRKYMHRHAANAFSHPRAELVIDDAKAWLERTDQKFDVMIFDLADPLDNGPCFQLYATEFYKQVVQPKLKPDGIFVTQSGPAGLISSAQVFTAIARTVGDSFQHSRPYTAFMQSFCDLYGFTLGSQVPLPELTAAQVNERLADRLTETDKERKEKADAHAKELVWRQQNPCEDRPDYKPVSADDPNSLSFYDGATHNRIMSLPIYARKQIAEEKRRITYATPLYLH